MYSLVGIEVGDKMDTDTLGASILGIFITGVIYLIGGIDELITSLIIIMIIDFILGIMAAYSTQSLNSYKIFKVLLKKNSYAFNDYTSCTIRFSNRQREIPTKYDDSIPNWCRGCKYSWLFKEYRHSSAAIFN